MRARGTGRVHSWAQRSLDIIWPCPSNRIHTLTDRLEMEPALPDTGKSQLLFQQKQFNQHDYPFAIYGAPTQCLSTVPGPGAIAGNKGNESHLGMWGFPEDMGRERQLSQRSSGMWRMEWRSPSSGSPLTLFSLLLRR